MLSEFIAFVFKMIVIISVSMWHYPYTICCPTYSGSHLFWMSINLLKFKSKVCSSSWLPFKAIVVVYRAPKRTIVSMSQYFIVSMKKMSVQYLQAHWCAPTTQEAARALPQCPCSSALAGWKLFHGRKTMTKCHCRCPLNVTRDHVEENLCPCNSRFLCSSSMVPPRGPPGSQRRRSRWEGAASPWPSWFPPRWNPRASKRAGGDLWLKQVRAGRDAPPGTSSQLRLKGAKNTIK